MIDTTHFRKCIPNVLLSDKSHNIFLGNTKAWHGHAETALLSEVQWFGCNEGTWYHFVLFCGWSQQGSDWTIQNISKELYWWIEKKTSKFQCLVIFVCAYERSLSYVYTFVHVLMRLCLFVFIYVNQVYNLYSFT